MMLKNCSMRGSLESRVFGVRIIFKIANCDLEASLTQKGKSKYPRGVNLPGNSV